MKNVTFFKIQTHRFPREMIHNQYSNRNIVLSLGSSDLVGWRMRRTGVKIDDRVWVGEEVTGPESSRLGFAGEAGRMGRVP